ncbi:phage head-tail connector protein [Enterococcus sp. BWR-S5]|uniref:phage head-tail connector protein n=1 Tax=Enterococcus sp. BWR-S5 TaxID=2787714 RepID=UPI001921F8BF|nr:phage head-tail connector protein [Enterococcus sp. BWR-S5]MBL1225371.1 phage head-tail connector protein [Enterococcus sp. BWR-S5]
MSETLEEVKRSLEIEDTEIDKQLEDFIKRISSQLCVRLGFLESVPETLNYIVVECTIKRFNRKGNEGMNSYGQEGESISYGQLLDEFEDDIEAYNYKQKEKSLPRRGVARFL